MGPQLSKLILCQPILSFWKVLVSPALTQRFPKDGKGGAHLWGGGEDLGCSAVLAALIPWDKRAGASSAPGRFRAGAGDRGTADTQPRELSQGRGPWEQKDQDASKGRGRGLGDLQIAHRQIVLSTVSQGQCCRQYTLTPAGHHVGLGLTDLLN